MAFGGRRVGRQETGRQDEMAIADDRQFEWTMLECVGRRGKSRESTRRDAGRTGSEKRATVQHRQIVWRSRTAFYANATHPAIDTRCMLCRTIPLRLTRAIQAVCNQVDDTQNQRQSDQALRRYA